MSDTTTTEICYLCGEEGAGPFTATKVNTPEGVRQTHPECMLRSVTGGIGHLIAHHYWCDERGDPDAGLTFHQSAKLASEYLHVVGTKHTEDV